MWLWIVSVVILLGFSAALVFRYEKQLKNKDDKFSNFETQAQEKIASLNDLVDEKRGMIKRQDDKISVLSLEKRRLDTQVKDLNSEINTHKTKISGLEKDVESLEKTVSGNTADIAKKKQEISSLQDQLKKKTNTLTVLQKKQKELDAALKKANEQARVNFVQMSAAMSARNKYKKKTEDYEDLKGEDGKKEEAED